MAAVPKADDATPPPTNAIAPASIKDAAPPPTEDATETTSKDVANSSGPLAHREQDKPGDRGNEVRVELIGQPLC